MIFLFIADYITTVIAALIAVQARNLALLPLGGIMMIHLSHLLLLPIPLLCFMYSYGIYNTSMHFWNVIEKIFKSCALSFVFLLLLQYFRSNSYVISRLFLAFFVIITFILLILVRYIVKKSFRKLGFFQEKTLLVGDGEIAESIVGHMNRDIYDSTSFVGIISDDYPVGTKIGGNEVIGGYSDFAKIAAEKDFDEVMIFAQKVPSEWLSAIINEAQPLVGKISVIPDIPGLPVGNITVESLYYDKTTALIMKNNLKNPLFVLTKQIMDYAIAIPLSLFVLPLMAVMALLIRMDSKGPAIYTGKRIGKNGKLFRCYKFRSMYLNNQKLLDEYLAGNPEAKAEWEEYNKLRGYDPRVTKFGKFMRKTSLDEIPQILNVLKGDMSLVGPRPYLPYEDLEDEGSVIMMVKPGITGLWQTGGRNEINFHDRLQMESWYVRNWSVWIDIVLLFRTVKVVLKGKGAY